MIEHTHTHTHIHSSTHSQETVKQVELVYLNHINTSCCSPECILLDEMDFDPEECNKACPNATEYYRAQVPVENETVVNLDLELEYSRVFGSAVNLSSSAIHVPVNIYDQGVWLYVCVCVCV